MQVLVAEPDGTLRAALCVWVGHLRGGKLAGVARNSGEVLPALRTSHADLALLDWDLIADQVAQVVAEAQRLASAPRLVVLSARPELAQAALHMGVDAVVDKQRLPETLNELLPALTGKAT